MSDFVALNDPELRQQRERGSAGSTGFFIAEGPIVVRRLVRSDYRVRSILVTERGHRALEADLADVQAPVYLVEQAVLDAICGFNFHRGVLASADRRPLPELSALGSTPGPLVLMEGINDHENLGAIFRNAAAFSVTGAVLDPTCADPLYRRSVRVSMGHVLGVPFTRAEEWPGDVERLRALGFQVLALTPAADAEDVRRVEPRPRQALLLGAEAPGLSPAALAAADRRVKISMAPGVDSLNVATAAAVVLHHLVARGDR